MPRGETGAAFKFVGGALCLDFVNTVSGRLANPVARGRDYSDRVETERLVDYPALMRWGQAAGVLPPREASTLAAAASARLGGGAAQAKRVLVRGRALREAMYRVFKAAVEQWTPPAADLAVINRELAHARRHERLEPDPGAGRLAWSWSTEGPAFDRVLWPVVRSAAELLTSELLNRLNQCGGEDCHWLFLDTSRNQSRRWCDMAECGNRAKVRDFRRRRSH